MGKSKQPEFIVDANGKPQAVVLDIDEYRRLMEDIEDLRLVRKRRGESALPAKDVWKRLRKLGKL